MRAVILKDEDAKDLLNRLELSKFHQKDMTPKQLLEIEDMHRSFHFHVASWLNEHGFKTL